MSKPLGLSVPKRQKPDKGAFSIRPRKVEQWIEALPKANLGETARQVYKVLLETNQLDLPHQERTRFLESLREVVQYITDSMRKHFIGVAYPLPEKNQKIAAATREILIAMTTGYKITFEDSLNSNFLFQDKKQLALLIHRAISYTGQTLLTSYQIYAPYPPKLWAEMHKLYAYAESYKLTRTGIADYQHMYVDKSSIKAEYLRNMLLWLTSPYRLRQGEVTKVYNTLERWVQYCEVVKPTQPEDPAADGQFGINLGKDQPPCPIAQNNFHCSPANCRVLQTSKLAERIRHDMQQAEDVVTTTLTGIDMGRQDLSHDLLRRLLIAWGIETKRGFPRTSKQEDVQVAIGLSAIHQFLTSHRQESQHIPNDPFAHRAEFESSVVKSLSDENPDVWNMVYPDGKDVDLTKIVTEELAISGEPPPSSANLPVYSPEKPQKQPDLSLGSWLIINESASGYCLEYGEGNSTKAQVGELVGIRRRTNNQSWNGGIGVIRWMKFNSQQEMQLGIEMLNPDAAAIGLRTAATNDKDLNYQRTLLLPEIPAIKQQATLITAPVPWRVGNKLMLNILGKDVRAALTHLVQNTGLFAQFQFKFQDTDKTKESAEQEERRDDQQAEQDFGLVWSSI
ncbi:MAG: hypothetical protein HKM94_10830 [Halobacteria archaeon]|nr:hypothetical protein [Halobacteria archaeon]